MDRDDMSSDNLDHLEGELSASTLEALREHLEAPRDDRNKTAPHSEAHGNDVYSRMEYWDSRFEDEDQYEWLLGWEQLSPVLVPHLSPEMEILVLGCGNSTLSADLYDAGFKKVTSLDFSQVVVQKLIEEHSVKRPEMRWDCMDMTDLSYEDGTFDVVLDKAAMDAIMVDEGDVWDPDEEVKDKAHAMCAHISRVLKPGGVYLQVSFMQPHFRRWYLLSRDRKEDSHQESRSSVYAWSVQHEEIHLGEGGSLANFLYICRLEGSKHDES